MIGKPVQFGVILASSGNPERFEHNGGVQSHSAPRSGSPAAAEDDAKMIGTLKTACQAGPAYSAGFAAYATRREVSSSHDT